MNIYIFTKLRAHASDGSTAVTAVAVATDEAAVAIEVQVARVLHIALIDRTRPNAAVQAIVA